MKKLLITLAIIIAFTACKKEHSFEHVPICHLVLNKGQDTAFYVVYWTLQNKFTRENVRKDVWKKLSVGQQYCK